MYREHAYQERLDFINRLAREAGQLTLEGFGRSDQIPKDGGDGYDITTECDLRAEELVKARIGEVFGEPVLGEEEGLLGDREVARRRLWIVDPIDGTFNYQRGLHLYGVSIAYCQGGVPVCGAIYLPALGQLLYAVQGAGAFMAEGDASPRPIHVAQRREITQLVIGFAGQHAYRLLAACAAEGIPWRSIRYTMCAVADLAYIAAGRMDAYCHPRLNLWDCAAADVILREAGAPPTCDFGGVPIFPEYVRRRLDGDDQGSFTFVAVSSPEVFQEPIKRLLVAAGFRST